MLKHIDANGNVHNVKEIRKKKGMLPHGLVLYEYLQSTGTLWIDTGFIPTSSSEIEIKFNLTRVFTNNTLLGSRNNSTSNGRILVISTGNRIGAMGSNNYGSTQIENTNVHIIKYSLLNKNAIVDGTTITITSTMDYTNPTTMWLFDTNGYGNTHYPGEGNIYYCKMYNNGTLVRNFVPCTYRNIPGMWDTVENKFYGNQGTGLFTLGNKITLKEYEYLQSSGTLYIDTGLSLSLTSKFEFETNFTYSNLTGTPTTFYGTTGGYTTGFMAMYHYTNNHNYALYIKGGYLGDADRTIEAGTKLYSKTTIDVPNKTWATLINDIVNRSGSYTNLITDTTSIIQIFKGGSYTAYATKCYDFKIKIDNVLVRDYIPCSYNGTPGLWDKVEWKFYSNAGTGSFTIGNEVKSYDSIYEIRKPKVNNLLPDGLELYEYLESTGTLWINTGFAYTSEVTETYCKYKVSANLDKDLFGCSYNNARWITLYKNMAYVANASAVGLGHTLDAINEVTFTTGALNTPLSIVCNGVTKSSANKTASTIFGVNMALFTMLDAVQTTLHQSRIYSGKIYKFSMKQDGVLVRNLVPCKYNGQAGMWDTVTSTFYGNSGTGQFTLGPRLHLLECEYIESTGTLYIDTGIVVNSYFKIQTKFLFTATSNFLILYGMMPDSSNTTPRMSFCGYSTTWMAGINNTVLFGTQDTLPHILLHIYNERNGEVIAVDGTGTIVLNNPSSISSNTLSLWLFTRHLTTGSTYPASARMYFYKLYDANDTLLRDYVPCICNGEVGLFDKVELKFYGNSGTGQFTTGSLKTDIIYLHKDYSKLYLTFEAIEDCTFKIGKAISYSIDEGNNWSSLSANTYSPTVTAGNRIMWKGLLTSTSNQGPGTFISTGNFNVEGNIMSIVCGYNDNAFIGLEDIGENNYLFKSLFEGCTRIINAKNMALPATILSRECYAGMFYGCTNLVTAPRVLPGKTLGRGCYQQMFYGCTSLVSTPKLLATTLEELCCSSMFYNCTSLTEISELPATTLADSCYSSMFGGCTSLVIIPKLPATTLASSCYKYMFDTCTSLVIPPELPATTLASGCYSDMFRDCTSLTIMPKLPATTLASSCYSNMFRNCTALKATLLLPVVTLALSCYNEMFYNCTSLTVAPQLPATILVDYCYQYMFQGCTSLTTAPELPAMTLAYDCYYGMFRECTALTTAPELPAETLVSGCYQYMFNNCNSLNYIKALFTSSANETSSWVSNVASSGTFVKSIAAINWNVRGNNGIPTNWNIEIYEECMPLTFTAVTSGTFKCTKSIDYSLDNGNTWTTLNANTNTPTISANSSIMWKGYTDSLMGNTLFSSTGQFRVSNNIMSIKYGLDFYHLYDMSSLSDGFYSLFKDCTGLVDASRLCLPATTIKSYSYMFYGCTNLVYSPIILPATTIAISEAYSYMFYNCTSLLTTPIISATEFTVGSSHCFYMFGNCSSLTTAPELPAMTLTNNCYQSMFRNCTSLVNPPALPATNMVYQCYAYMFRGCTSLETAPDLMAETIVNGCYNYMFADCTSLNSIKAYFTTTPSTSVTSNWVENVASTGTFHKNPNATWDVTGIHGIPTNWTVVSRPAYESMYFTIESVGTVDAKVRRSVSSPVLGYSLDNGTTWSNFTTSVVTLAPGSSMIIKGTVAPSGNSGYGYILATAGNIKVYGNIMSLRYGDNFENLTSLTNNYIFYRLFYQCTRLTDVENLILPATTLSNYCYSGMFYLCTNITKAPVLPALGLVTLCYSLMFYDCSNLSYIKAMFRTTPSTTYTNGWVSNVASSGIFVKNSAATWTTTGSNGVPTGWTVQTVSE